MKTISNYLINHFDKMIKSYFSEKTPEKWIEDYKKKILIMLSLG
jgi:hypothetical protein